MANTSACTDSDTTNVGAALALLLIGGTRVCSLQSEISNDPPQMGRKSTNTRNHPSPHLIMDNAHLNWCRPVTWSSLGDESHHTSHTSLIMILGNYSMQDYRLII